MDDGNWDRTIYEGVGVMPATVSKKRPRPTVSAALKALQTRLSEAREGHRISQQQADVYRQSAQSYLAEAHRLQAEIDRLVDSQKELVVSEHATLRYFERALKINLEEIRKEILPEEVAAQAHLLGNGTYPVNGGAHRVRIQNGVVVTVLGEEE